MKELVDVLVHGVLSPSEEIVATLVAQIDTGNMEEANTDFSCGAICFFHFTHLLDCIQPGVSLSCALGRFNVAEVSTVAVTAIFEKR